MDEYKTDRTFKALADPTRRALLTQLASGAARVTELAAPHQMSLNSVSKHLRVLEAAGLVRRRVRGREHWFEFQQPPLAQAGQWLGDMLAFWEARLDALDDYLQQPHEEKPA